MNIKKVLRTVVLPVATGVVAAGISILLSRPAVKVTIDPDYDVPTDVDEPPFTDSHVVETATGVFELKPTVKPARKPKTV